MPLRVYPIEVNISRLSTSAYHKSAVQLIASGSRALLSSYAQFIHANSPIGGDTGTDGGDVITSCVTHNIRSEHVTSLADGILPITGDIRGPVVASFVRGLVQTCPTCYS